MSRVFVEQRALKVGWRSLSAMSFVPFLKLPFVYLFVCWVICFLSQNKTTRLPLGVASIIAAYLRHVHLRGPYHPSPATITAHDQFTREVGGVFKE